MKLSDFAPIAMLSSVLLLLFAVMLLGYLVGQGRRTQMMLRGGCDLNNIEQIKPGYFTQLRHVRDGA